MTSTDNDNLFKFFELIGTLKHHKRRGWIQKGFNDCETVTDHMYRMAMMTFVIDDNNIDKIKCLKLALVHDLGECITGDITIHDNISSEKKHELDNNATKEIANLLGCHADEIYNLYKEYAEHITPEGRFVKQLDKFELILQAFEYEKKLRSPLKFEEFFINTRNDLKDAHPWIKKLVDDLHKKRDKFIEEFNNDTQ